MSHWPEFHRQLIRSWLSELKWSVEKCLILWGTSYMLEVRLLYYREWENSCGYIDRTYPRSMESSISCIPSNGRSLRVQVIYVQPIVALLAPWQLKWRSEREWKIKSTVGLFDSLRAPASWVVFNFYFQKNFTKTKLFFCQGLIILSNPYFFYQFNPFFGWKIFF